MVSIDGCSVGAIGVGVIGVGAIEVIGVGAIGCWRNADGRRGRRVLGGLRGAEGGTLVQ